MIPYPIRAARPCAAVCLASAMALAPGLASSQEASQECLELIANFYEETGVDAQSTDASLRADLRDLSTGARVLAEHGNEEGCRQIVARMEDLYATRTGESEKATSDLTIAETRFVEAVPFGQLQYPLRAEALLGKDVHNRMGDVIGEIADVVVALDEQGRGFALISHGGFLGLGSELTPVSWSALRYAAEPDVVFLDVTTDDLAAAPSITTTDDGVPPIAEWADEADGWWRSWQSEAPEAAGATKG